MNKNIYEAPETEVVLLDMGQVMTNTSVLRKGSVTVQSAEEDEYEWDWDE